MTELWTPDDLQRIASADELQIAPRRTDGTLRRWVPIWVVCVDEQVYVRTWYRRNTGWFAHVLDSHRACVRVPGLQTDVSVEHVGTGSERLRADVDTAYRTKYARYGTSTVDQMVAPEAAATTLLLAREQDRLS
ncbi:DUF2255 family protein [Kribbella italica]|uniref:DUF2255 family protein n=1 Tax=Kribbella italica TaxID=1540520 RepID=A0A7W9J6Q7_9ACTN|nr:DUF2255 family protein [Kribbella italica]MBB5836602.1 hypothetical protein [Kribbella italica]